MTRPDSDTVEMNVRDGANEEEVKVDVDVDVAPVDNEPKEANAAASVPADQNTAALTVGSLGHVFRRVYHILIFTSFSYIYYFHVVGWGEDIGFSARKLISIGLLVQIAIELIRIKMGIICFGFRSYERHQISAQAWGTIGAGLVLLSAPQRHFASPLQTNADRAYIGMPIIWCLGILDPLIGELKGHGVIGRRVRSGAGFNAVERSVIATITAVLIWVVIGLIIGESEWWFIIIVAPLTILAEYPSLKIIDDNAMMTLVPLGAALLLQPFFSQQTVA